MGALRAQRRLRRSNELTASVAVSAQAVDAGAVLPTGLVDGVDHHVGPHVTRDTSPR